MYFSQQPFCQVVNFSPEKRNDVECNLPAMVTGRADQVEGNVGAWIGPLDLLGNLGSNFAGQVADGDRISAVRFYSVSARFGSDSLRQVSHLSDTARSLSDTARYLSDTARYLSDTARYLSDIARYLSDTARYLSDINHTALQENSPGDLRITRAGYRSQVKAVWQAKPDGITTENLGGRGSQAVFCTAIFGINRGRG